MEIVALGHEGSQALLLLSGHLPAPSLTCGARVMGLTYLHPSLLALGRALFEAGVELVTMGAQATLGKDSPYAWPQALGRLCWLSSCSICPEFFKERAMPLGYIV